MQGAADVDLPVISVRAAVALQNDGARPHYLRGRLVDGKFMPTGKQESHALFGLSQSRLLVKLAANATVAEGDFVQALVCDA
jgi:molybdopterin biosynthesis enzyme